MPITTATIRELALEVLEAREQAADTKANLEEARTIWEQENWCLVEEARANKESLRLAEAELRHAALEIYAQTREKHPGPGVQIKLVTGIIFDQALAYNWAVNHGMCLKLEENSFRDAVKAQLVPSHIASIHEGPRADIALDLGKVLRGTEPS